MAIDLVKYQELKAKSEKAKSEADRAAGLLEGQMKKLKADFDVDTLEEAEAKLAELDKEIATIEKDYNTALESFEKKWGDKF